MSLDGQGISNQKTDSDHFASFIVSNGPRLERALADFLPVSKASGTERFNDALAYALFPGGKRLRPHLTTIAARLGGASDDQALKLACAIEFIHSSSLVLDDLPAMDDAELRRKLPALHITFGEGIAVLVAVALLNQAYKLFSNCSENTAEAERLPRLFNEAAACIGNEGMIAGQAAELVLSGAHSDRPASASRALKTTGLMRLMMIVGGIMSGAAEADIAALGTFGESLGRAYQIYDDLADSLGDRHSTGKSVGQDLRHRRPTAVTHSSTEEARTLANNIIVSGKEVLGCFGERTEVELLRSGADHVAAQFDRIAVHHANS